MSDTDQSPMDPSSEKREDPKVIHPDSIIIEPQNGNPPHLEANEYNAENLAGSKGPLVLRLICLVGSLCCFLLAVGFLVGAAIAGLGSIVFLFRNPVLNKALFRYLKYVAASIIGTFGFLVGVLSPLIGFTILVFYFSLTDSSFLQSMMSKTMRQ